MQSIIVTTTTVTKSETNVGRAAILYSNRYGATPTLGRGGELILGGYVPAHAGRAGYMIKSGLIGVVEGETSTAYRVRLLNGPDEGVTYTVNKSWIELA
ncbi:hypothetical protein SEA_ZOOMAN_344 [Microbacterium phage Zooman]|nr:hypothetical protein SEA_ZOOMAN_31 [Microbacterium phage Zooman]UDL16585.1 hypothetical protein SEA_ZOOMAN_344 [Microbacterium phage Zooman]